MPPIAYTAWTQVLRPQKDNPKMVIGSDSMYYSLFQFLHQQMKGPKDYSELKQNNFNLAVH